MSAFNGENIKYSEAEFIKIINEKEFFTNAEIDKLIERTKFETLNAEMIRRCNGSEEDYCETSNGIRYKCCISQPPSPHF